MNKDKFKLYIANETSQDNTSYFEKKCISNVVLDTYKIKQVLYTSNYIDDLKDYTHICLELDDKNEYSSFVGFNSDNNELSVDVFNLRYLNNTSLIKGNSKVLFISDSFINTLSFETIYYKAIYVNPNNLHLLKQTIQQNISNITEYNVNFILDIKDNTTLSDLTNFLTELNINNYIYPIFSDENANEFLIRSKRDFTLKTISFVKNTILGELNGYKQVSYSDYNADIGNLEVLDILSTEEILTVQNGKDSSSVDTVDLSAMSLLERAQYCWNNPVNPETLLKTGIDGFDKAIRYFERKGILIGAIPGMSKTSFCLAIAVNMALAKKHCIFFSLEMDKMFITSKILANLTYRKELSPKPLNQEDIYIFLCESVQIFTLEEYNSLIKCIKFYQDNIEPFLHIDDFSNSKTKELASKSIEAIRVHTDNFILKHKIKPVIFIDYIQQLTVENSDKSQANDKIKLDYITNILIDMKKKMGITMFLISSLNRESYNTVISKTSFKESGSIEYAAEYLLGIQWRQMYKRVQSLKNKGEQDMYTLLLNKMSGIVGFKELEMVAAKGRTGGEGDSIYLNFHFLENRFETVTEECLINPDLSKSFKENIDMAYEIRDKLKNGIKNNNNSVEKDNTSTVIKRKRL